MRSASSMRLQFKQWIPFHCSPYYCMGCCQVMLLLCGIYRLIASNG